MWETSPDIDAYEGSGMVKVGVVGLGMGCMHLEAYARVPDAKVYALCDLNQ